MADKNNHGVNHIDILKREFQKQAKDFNAYQNVSSKEKCTNQVLEQLSLTGQEEVLEIAAGTCSFGRRIAPFVKHIVELDAVEEMLLKGKEENEKANITNASYMNGNAEDIPFRDNCFDIVVSRLAFHHFVNPDNVFNEMVRVLKPDGRLVILDMIANQDNLRKMADYYEKLRDPSHIKTFTENEFFQMLKQHSLIVECKNTICIPMELDAWLSLTEASNKVREEITSALQMEISGGTKTGLFPYIENKKIRFSHHWIVMIARK